MEVQKLSYILFTMINFPQKNMSTPFLKTGEEIGFSKDEILSHYKRWLYVWACHLSKPKKKEKVLEIGPGGTKAILRYCLNRGANVSAIDMRKPKKMYDKVNFIQGDLFKSKLEKYNHIYCISVLEHIPPKLHDKFFKKIAESLLPGGKFYLSTVDRQRVLNGSKNIAMEKGLLYPVTIDYIFKPKEITLLNSGPYMRHPDWKDKDIIWKMNGGKEGNKQWTEYCCIFIKK